MGPLGFALTLQPFIEKIKAEVPGFSLNAWYIDDGTLVGSPEDLAVVPEDVGRSSAFGARVGAVVEGDPQPVAQ